MDDSQRTEQLDSHDHAVLSELGYAVGRAQLFELALLRLLEVQRFDLDAPLEEKWPHIQEWLTRWTAGRTSRELHLPEAVAQDVSNLVKRRNVVAHQAWLHYIAHRERHGGAASAEIFTKWLVEQAAYLGHAFDALKAMTEFGRHRLPVDLEGKEAMPVWRHFLPNPVPEADVPKI